MYTVVSNLRLRAWEERAADIHANKSEIIPKSSRRGEASYCLEQDKNQKGKKKAISGTEWEGKRHKG